MLSSPAGEPLSGSGAFAELIELSHSFPCLVFIQGLDVNLKIRIHDANGRPFRLYFVDQELVRFSMDSFDV